MRLPMAVISSSIFLLCFLPWFGAATGNSTSTGLSSSDAITVVSITQLLSLFSISLDLKDFSALRNVFAPDAVLTGGGGADPITGIAAIEAFYTTTFQNQSLKTQHTSDTVYGYNFTDTTASSTSYATVAYFGPAILERGGFLFPNTSVVFRERFDSEYTKNADGALRISQQALTLLVRELGSYGY